MTEEQNSAFVQFMRQVGIVCGGVIAVSTVVGWGISFLWTNATRDIVTSIDRLQGTQVKLQEAVAAGERRDSLIVEQVAKLGEAMRYSLGSDERDRALTKVQRAPRAVRDYGGTP